MAVERYTSKTDVVVKLVLVFFVSLLSFSIGTFVGKKFSDNQHKLAQFEPEANSADRDIASVHSDATELKPKDALSDDEIAKLAEEFVSDDEGAPAHAVDAHSPTKQPTPPAPEKTHDKNVTTHTEAKAHSPAPASANEPMAVAKRVVQNMTPEPPQTAPSKPQPRIPQSLPQEVASSAMGKYTVQVGAYPLETEAQKIASELKDKGFSAFYVSAKIKDQTWYRVSVGLFNTQKEADNYKKDLLSRAKVSSAFVQKIAN